MRVDFGPSEKCIERLSTAVSKGFIVEVHAGDQPDSSDSSIGETGKKGKKVNQCINGDTNAMAAFLIAAGEYSYYHCSGDTLPCGTKWSSCQHWPNTGGKDYWLDWLLEYDYPLGAPLGSAQKTPSKSSSSGKGLHLWTREFATGTKVAFDAGSGNGTISWAHGLVQTGKPTPAAVAQSGCSWQTM